MLSQRHGDLTVCSAFTLVKTITTWKATGGGRNLLLKAWYSNGLRYQDRISLCVYPKKNSHLSLSLFFQFVKCVVISSNHIPLQSLGFSLAFQKDSSSATEISQTIGLSIDLCNSTIFTTSKKYFGLLAS